MRATHTCRHHARSRTVHCTVAKSSQPGFRWDPANSRWVKSAKNDGKDMPAVMTPFTGSQYTVWPVMHTQLTAAGLKSITTAEASQLVQKGWTLVDVRLEDQYNKQHPVGAVSVPMYRYVQGNSKWDNLKRLAMAGFAMKATERNPDFTQLAAERVKKNGKVILMCDMGGTLKTKVTSGKKTANDPERAFGRETRSLKAAFELLQDGWSVNNILHLTGGVPQWRYDGYPIESSK